MTSKRMMIWITALLPVALAVIYYSRLPQIVAIHWGMSGNPNGYAPRMAVPALAGISIVVTLLGIWGMHKEPNQEHMRRSKRFYESTIVLLNLTILAVTALTVSEALRPGQLDVGCIATAIVGLLFVWIGNYLPKTASNHMMGVRNRWTLSDEKNWKKTQRISGWMLFISGFLIFISAFALPPLPRVVLMIAVVTVSIVGSTVVSYEFHQKEQ